MSKYIEADALKVNMRGAFIDHIEEFRAITIVDDAPSIDIVRCKDCKYWNYEMSGCKRNPSVVAWRDNDFCSYGERLE